MVGGAAEPDGPQQSIGWSQAAGRHLWSHFSAPTTLPIIERADGCYMWDDSGHRLLDGLAGPFAPQVGHGRQELAQAAYEQMSQLAYFPMWGYGHPPGQSRHPRRRGPHRRSLRAKARHALGDTYDR